MLVQRRTRFAAPFKHRALLTNTIGSRTYIGTRFQLLSCPMRARDPLQQLGIIYVALTILLSLPNIAQYRSYYSRVYLEFIHKFDSRRAFL